VTLAADLSSKPVAAVYQVLHTMLSVDIDEVEPPTGWSLCNSQSDEKKKLEIWARLFSWPGICRDLIP